MVSKPLVVKKVSPNSSALGSSNLGSYSTTAAGKSRELTSEDYQTLFSLSSTRIACFDFDRDIYIRNTPDTIIDTIWSTPSRCVQASLAFAQAFGLTESQDALGKSFADFFPRNRDNMRLIRAWIGNGFYLSNYPPRLEDCAPGEITLQHSIFPRIEGQYLKRFWLVSRDVTEVKRALADLQRAEAHYRAIAEAPGLLLLRATPEGRYVYMSPALEDLLGYGIEDFNALPTLWDQLIHPDDSEMTKRLWQASSTRLHQPLQIEYRIRGRDGQYRWLLHHQAPKFFESGKPEFYDGVIVDIDKRKSLEEELVHSKRLETLGTLAGGIAHDFNNHLTAILGQIRLAIRDLPPEAPSFAKLAAAEQATLSCAEIAKQLLSLGKKTDSKLGAVAVPELLENTVTLLEHLFPSHIEIHLLVQPGILYARGNTAQLQQVLMNLALNARDAMPDGGTLEIGADLFVIDSLSPTQLYGTLTPGEYIKIFVKDNGKGIPDSDLPKVFDPFFTTKSAERGTGLGLTMVFSIIKAHGGSLSVQSKPGRGTMFSFLLPQAAPPANQTTTRPHLTTPGGNECILLAEDDELVRGMAETTLRMHGYEIVSAKNGQEALDLFRLHQKKNRLGTH